MYTIGVMGGVGAGKSTVLTYLEENYDALVTRLDDVAKSLMEPGKACYEEAVKLFGTSVVSDDGSLDRGYIAKAVFRDTALLKNWEARVHPLVKEETDRLYHMAEAERRAIFVIESAILLKEKYDAFCNELWYIYADEATRYRRLAVSRGYSRERMDGIMRSQMTEAEFRTRANVVIDNSGSEIETHKQVDLAIRRILEEA